MFLSACFPHWDTPWPFRVSGASKQVEGLHKAVGLDLRQPQGAQVEDLCGLGNEGPNRKGLVEGHSLWACMAPFGARFEYATITTPRGTYGPRAVVLPQVKAYSLVQTFSLRLFPRHYKIYIWGGIPGG